MRAKVLSAASCWLIVAVALTPSMTVAQKQLQCVAYALGTKAAYVGTGATPKIAEDMAMAVCRAADSPTICRIDIKSRCDETPAPAPILDR